MSKLFLIPLALVLLASCSRIYAPVAREDHQVATEDLGVRKYTFMGRAMSGQVVVFREDTYMDGKLWRRNDQVSNKRNGDFAQPVVFIDKSILSGTMGSGYILRTPAGGGLVGNVRWVSCSFDPSLVKAEFVFKYNADDHFNANKELKYIYTMFVEPYQTAKTRIPALPNDAPPDSWTYSDSKFFGP